VPENGIIRLQHPVVFIGEIEQLAWNTQALQGVKGAESLGIGHPIVQRTVDDQHWRFPVFDEVHRVVLFVAGWIIPGRADMVPLGEPELLGIEICHSLVNVAVVVYQTAETVGPITRYPVNHITAEGGAEGADPVGIHPGVTF
jgi:hypothetical protein